MAEFDLPYFGKLHSDNLEQYYDAEIDFNGLTVSIDLNFYEKAISSSIMEQVHKLLNNIDKFDEQNKMYIYADYNSKNGDTVKFYLEHHLENIDEEDLSTLINFENKIISPEKQLLAKLQLIRVGLFPEEENNFATFDYSIGEELTNYLVVITINDKGELDNMTMES